MNLSKFFSITTSIVGSVFFSLSNEMMIEEVVSIGLFIYFLLDFISSIGESYHLMDITILLAFIQCLLMPLIVFHVYNTDQMVISLKYDMGVTAEIYYQYMFPAVLALIFGIKLPEVLRKSYNATFIKTVSEAKQYLVGRGNLGVLLIIIGIVSSFMQIFIPGELKYVAYLFSKLLYVGVIYTFFSDDKNRKWYLMGGIVAILAQSLTQGMFGELVYTLALGVMLIVLGKKIKVSLKYAISVIGFVFVLLLQSIKSDYRNVAWKQRVDREESTKAFFSLLADRVTSPDQFFDWTLMFPTINRFNQGMIVGKVMVHVPKNAPYAEGETIYKSLAASFVPRLLWPNKPTSGGHFNMERFTGFIIEGYSMNISPMGEAYGNFGAEGGVVFMFFYGLFFSVAIYIIMNVARKKPTLILWFPILFLNSVQVETDILMCVNSLLKNLIFIAFCYWAANRFLRLKL